MHFPRISQFLMAGYLLLATSAAAPADPAIEPDNNLNSPALALKHPITHRPKPTTTSHRLPGSCYTTTDDFEHTRATVLTHECYTRTSLIPAASCPILSCAPPPTPQVCPLYIKVSMITVPCATDCCPKTSTTYEAAGPCSTCDPCRIPTEWITYTTGCIGTPTITETNVITPAY